MARFSIGDIETLFFEAYPPADALEGDRFGLLVGDRRELVKRIAISLDQTIPQIEAAAALGCNLLVSHHPVFWAAPDSFVAADSAAVSSGAPVYKAAQLGVALLNLHTCLDCAPSAANMLLDPVGLTFVAPLRAHGTGGLGQLARPAGAAAGGALGGAPGDMLGYAAGDAPGVELGDAPGYAAPVGATDSAAYVQLGELALRYKQAFGAVAKVWGDPDKPLFTVAVCSGAGGDVVADAIAAGADCLVTGELRHHEALYVSDTNMALIELGHDISELPYRFLLRDSLIAGGFTAADIVVLEPSATWWQV